MKAIYIGNNTIQPEHGEPVVIESYEVNAVDSISDATIITVNDTQEFALSQEDFNNLQNDV
jgi:hypothetical protein